MFDNVDNKPGLLSWLLEPVDPGVQYLALKDLVSLSVSDYQLIDARKTAHEQGPIAKVLTKMDPEGFWVKPGPGYSPKYHSTVWSIILLAQLGATVEEDERIRVACDYLMGHALTKGGYFTYSGAPSGTFDCLQGNMCWALLELGVDDPRLDEAFDWMARSQTGEGVANKDDKKAEVRYYAPKCGPNFMCGANYNLPCAWGATKVMLAFSRLPLNKRTGVIQNAIQRGVDFFFSIEPATATWSQPLDTKPSRNWWKFGFPVFYNTDLLQVAEAMTALDYGKDPQLAKVITLIRDKQDFMGRWALEYNYAGKTWNSFGPKNKPNKWVTLRALRVLNAVGQIE